MVFSTFSYSTCLNTAEQNNCQYYQLDKVGPWGKNKEGGPILEGTKVEDQEQTGLCFAFSSQLIMDSILNIEQGPSKRRFIDPLELAIISRSKFLKGVLSVTPGLYPYNWTPLDGFFTSDDSCETLKRVKKRGLCGDSAIRDPSYTASYYYLRNTLEGNRSVINPEGKAEAILKKLRKIEKKYNLSGLVKFVENTGTIEILDESLLRSYAEGLGDQLSTDSRLKDRLFKLQVQYLEAQNSINSQEEMKALFEGYGAKLCAEDSNSATSIDTEFVTFLDSIKGYHLGRMLRELENYFIRNCKKDPGLSEVFKDYQCEHLDVRKSFEKSKDDYQNVAIKSLDRAISSNLSQENALPIGLAVCAEFLGVNSEIATFNAPSEKVMKKKDCGEHDLAMVGQKWDQNTCQCKILIQNSYGDSCRYDDSTAYSSRGWECAKDQTGEKNGRLWAPKNDFSKIVIDVKPFTH
jgi:hypothetical protein